MGKGIIIGMVAALVVAGTAVAVGDSSEKQAPSTPTMESNPTKRQLSEAQRERIQLRARNCRTVGCFNDVIDRLTKAVKNLNRETYKCERHVNVTQYPGYVYSNDGQSFFLTTGLDYTSPGDPVSDKVLVYVC